MAILLILLAVADRLALQPCEIAGVGGRVECGDLSVDENRETGGGRKIPLHVVVLRATGAERLRDALYILQGGPGQAASLQARFYDRVFGEIRRSRDIVLADVRGTGKSNGLTCALPAGPELFPRQGVRACRATLAARADLARYNTAANVADIAEVLDALGIEAVNIYGTSYGTRLGLEFLRRHPGRVRTLALKGVVPPSMVMAEHFSRDAYRVLRMALTPEDERRLDRLLAKPPGGLSSGVLAEVVRNALYSPGSAADLAETLRRCEQGDCSAFLKASELLRKQWSEGVAAGMFFSVTCAEDVPFLRGGAAARLTARTLGEFRRAQQRAACAEWVAGKPGERKPVSSDVPALLISGDRDPVTPPSWGEEALRHLKNGRHVVLAGNGHPLGDQAPCVARMLRALIEERSVAHANCGP